LAVGRAQICQHTRGGARKTLTKLRESTFITSA
jgi:hypothetical protein